MTWGLILNTGILAGSFLHTSSVMFRRILKTPPDWAHHLACGDQPLFLELARHGDVRVIDECMAVYRVHPGGVWTGIDSTERLRKARALYQAYYDNFDPKYRPAIRRGLGKVVFDIALDQFHEGRPDLTRQSLGEFIRLSGPFDFLPWKALLALKGYGFWLFPAWRRIRRVLGRGHAAALAGGPMLF